MRPQIVAIAFLAPALLALGACMSKTEPAPATHAALGQAAAQPIAGVDHVAARLPSLPPRRTGGAARLPDRGTLVDYAKTNPSGNGAYRWHPVAVSEAHAISAIVSGNLDLTAPDGTPIHLRYDRHIEHPDGNWTWIGRPEGATAGNEAIITFGPDAVFGTIPTRDGAPLRLTTVHGQTWVMATDPASELKLADTERRETDGLLPPSIAGRRVSAAGKRTIAAAPSTAAASASPANTVDVLVGYTPQLAARFGSQTAANTRITFLIDVTNQAYVASQIDAAVRLVATMQVDYTETNSNAQALFNLTGVNCTEQGDGSLDCSDGAVPAGLAPLVTARAQYGADVVALVRTFRNTEQEGCGIAWLLGGGQSSITASDADYAYAVVSDSNGDGPNSFPSNNRVCRDEAFAHELGHIMGAQHDRETAAGDDGQLTADEYGHFAYSFGFRGGPANVYTVMAYGAAGQGKVRLFSNPNVLCSPSPGVPAAPCGIADQADNARALRQTLPVVATFRAMVARFGDVNGNYWAFDEIRRLANAGVTNGCSGATSTSLAMFCPEASVTREQMAAFLVRAKHGAAFVPPAATGMFADVPASDSLAPYIEQLARDGVTSGCGTNPARFCPSATVLRDQMAVFLIRARYGPGYTPPGMWFMFADVPPGHWAGIFIEKLANDGVTGGCNVNPPMYCPGDTVTRAQMAVFLVRSFAL